MEVADKLRLCTQLSLQYLFASFTILICFLKSISVHVAKRRCVMGNMIRPTKPMDAISNPNYEPPTVEERAAALFLRQPQLYQWKNTSWTPTIADLSSATSGMNLTDSINSFSVLTYNVWFGDHRFLDRCQEIMAIVQRLDPTFVAFQVECCTSII